MAVIGIIVGLIGAAFGIVAGAVGGFVGIVAGLLGACLGLAPILFPVVLITLGIIWLVRSANSNHGAAEEASRREAVSQSSHGPR